MFSPSSFLLDGALFLRCSFVPLAVASFVSVVVASGIFLLLLLGLIDWLLLSPVFLLVIPSEFVFPRGCLFWSLRWSSMFFFFIFSAFFFHVVMCRSLILFHFICFFAMRLIVDFPHVVFPLPVAVGLLLLLWIRPLFLLLLCYSTSWRSFLALFADCFVVCIVLASPSASSSSCILSVRSVRGFA